MYRGSHHQMEFKRKVLTILINGEYITECAGDRAFALIFVSMLVIFKALSSANFTFVIPGISRYQFYFYHYSRLLYFFKDQLGLASFAGFALIISGILIIKYK